MRSKYELDEDEMRAMLNRMEMLEAVLIYATLKAGGVLTIPRAEMEHFMKKYEDYAIVMEVGVQESTFRTMPRSGMEELERSAIPNTPAGTVH